MLAIDYRTIGSSGGRPRRQWFPERQVEDMRAWLSYLLTRAEVDPQRIGARHSVGAARREPWLPLRVTFQAPAGPGTTVVECC